MSDVKNGRAKQRERTRKALLEAAVHFVQHGGPFSVADAADRAMISRATAYRYFPNISTLMAEATLYAIRDIEEKEIGRSFNGVGDDEERLVKLVESSDRAFLKHNQLFRTMLRTAAPRGGEADDAPERVERRREMIREALADARGQLDAKAFANLTACISLFIGAEAGVVMTDVCQIGATEARRVKSWAAASLLRAALREAAPRTGGKARRTTG